MMRNPKAFNLPSFLPLSINLRSLVADGEGRSWLFGGLEGLGGDKTSTYLGLGSARECVVVTR